MLTPEQQEYIRETEALAQLVSTQQPTVKPRINGFEIIYQGGEDLKNSTFSYFIPYAQMTRSQGVIRKDKGKVT